MISQETGEEIEVTGPQISVPAGQYALYASINGVGGQSAIITFGVENATVVEIVAYFPDVTPGGGIVEGVGYVQLSMIECANWDRVGEIDFLQVASVTAASSTTSCTSGSSAGLFFSLVNVDDPAQVLAPTGATGGQVGFAEVPSGTWTITEASTDISSRSFTVSNQQVVQFRVISYVEGPIDILVEKVFCEDDERAGTTDFTVDSPPTYASAAAGSTCFAVPPSYQVILVDGFGHLASITPGTYIATESIDGVTISSNPFVVTEPGKRLRIINYILEESALPDPGQGFGTLSGTILYCSSPDRAEGDVDFITRTVSFNTIASTSECEFGSGTTGGMLTLYPVDSTTGEPDTEAATAIWTDGLSFWQDIIPSGYYVFAYTSPFTGETTLSSQFTIAHRAETIIDINVFSQPAFITYLDIAKDICVDPALAGQTSFQLNTEQVASQIAVAEEENATDCRYANPGDGDFELTLTNLDTGQSWTRSITGGDYTSFDNLLAGTYMFAETHNGITATSETFVLEPSRGQWHWMRIRNFVAEKDWTEPEPGENQGWIGIFAYSCTNPNRDGGIEWYRYPVVLAQDIALAAASGGDHVPTISDTSDCVTIGTADGIGFIATPVNGMGGPYTFFENGEGLFELTNFDGVPAGDYIITEVSTGATSGVVRVVYWTGFNFLMFQEQPKADVVLSIESADPSIASTLPADATWTITGVDDPTYTLSGTFPQDNLDLPTTITLDTPLTYGDYQLDIDAEPAFEPYSNVFTVGPLELASGQLFGLLQQPPDLITWNIVLQPAQEPGPSPSPSPSPSPTATATPGPGETPTPVTPAPLTPAPGSTSTPALGITQLPSTGNGTAASESGGLVILAGLAAAIAGAGAIMIRSRRV
jgi:hypothetical protein